MSNTITVTVDCREFVTALNEAATRLALVARHRRDELPTGTLATAAAVAVGVSMRPITRRQLFGLGWRQRGPA